MGYQTQSAALKGAGTVKKSGTALANTTLYAILIAAGYTDETLKFVKSADILVVTGTVYFENDGTAADANSMPFSEGDKWQIRNCAGMLLTQITCFVAAAVVYDFRIALFE